MKLEDWSILNHPGPTSPAMMIVAEDNWSYFGNHERLNINKKLLEQPRNNPIDPNDFLPGRMPWSTNGVGE